MTWCPPNEPPKPTKKLPVLAEKVESFVSTSSLSASCYVWPIKNSKGTNAIMQICKRCAFDQQTVEYVLGCFRSRAPPPHPHVHPLHLHCRCVHMQDRMQGQTGAYLCSNDLQHRVLQSSEISPDKQTKNSKSKSKSKKTSGDNRTGDFFLPLLFLALLMLAVVCFWHLTRLEAKARVHARASTYCCAIAGSSLRTSLMLMIKRS